jgi:SEC-C motif
MGAIAEGLVAYAQPLIDQTDGSHEQLNKAFAISQICFNLALLPEDERDARLSEMQPSLQMDDEEFEEFRRSILIPMIQRHHEMFPLMHQKVSTNSWLNEPLLQAQPSMAVAAETHPKIDRYAPCPCNSGEKYKFCCGKKGR